MIFSDLKAKIRSLIWAAGEAENLVIAHENMFQEAMGFLQDNVPEEKDLNTNVYPFCSTFYKCGTTIVPCPVGEIQRVFTIANGNWCDPVYYDRKEAQKPERWARNLYFIKNKNTNVTNPELPLGFQAADKSTDILNSVPLYGSSPMPGRARRGIWSIDGRNMVVAPWLQSNESLVIVWKGTKQVWNDDDIVSDQIDVQKFIKLYVAYAHERDFGDRSAKPDLERDMNFALGDVMINWKNNTRSRQQKNMEWRDRSPAELQMSNLPDVISNKSTFAIIGNYGSSTSPTSGLVAKLIAGWDVDMILTAGGNSTSGNYDVDAGQLYSAYISPYVGAYGAGAKVNEFWPCPGQPDWAMGNLNAYFNFFSSLSSQPFYTFCNGNVQFFLLDNLNGEPAGNTDSSSQAQWLKLQLSLSTAKWKIVIGNQTPFTSIASRVNPKAQWPYKTWGADIFISGSIYAYERLNVNGFPYIANGAGGIGGGIMDTFGTPTTGSLVRYNANNGAIKGSVVDGTFTLSFFDVNGNQQDTISLTK